MFDTMTTQHIPQLEQVIESHETHYTRYEQTVLLLALLLLASIFIIGVWSGILLLFGAVEGGGPLGTLFTWMIRLLTSIDLLQMAPDMHSLDQQR